MQNEILAEIKELRTALTQVLGISDLPPDQQFLKEALNKAAKEFQKLNILVVRAVGEHYLICRKLLLRSGSLPIT